MMDGRNCTGRTISLLNDSGDVTGVQAAKQQQHNPRHQRQQHLLPSPRPLLQHHQQYPSSQHHQHHLHHLQSPKQHHLHHSQQPHWHQQANIRLPPLNPARTSSSSSVVTTHSRASSSSAASTPASEPQTPLLVRSDSRAYSTPSPSTPSCNSFDQAAAVANRHHQRTSSQQHYYLSRAAFKHPAKMDDPIIAAPLYPPIPDAPVPIPAVYQLTPQMPSLPMQPSTQITESSNSPSSEPSHVSGVSNGSSKKPTPKKNQYPCPMAKQFGCNDYFTTSGHAARHAKKHTGKKDAFCPECNKAFTRKDNMEQHRRTHQNGRGNGRSSNSTNDDSKVKKSTKSSTKKSSVKVEPSQLEAAVEQQLSEPQPIAPASVSSSQQIPPLPINLSQVEPTPPMIPQNLQPQAVDASLLMQPSGPYFLSAIDTGPIPSLPNAVADLNMRPTLHRSSFANSLDYAPPLGPTMGGLDAMDALHFSYPSPGLSNGLNSLALASEHRRLSEEKASKSPSQENAPSTAAAVVGAGVLEQQVTPSDELTPLQETPSEESP